MANIDKMLEAGLPCTARRQWRHPEPDFEKNYGHAHWVSQNNSVEIL
ncbi:MAG: hypothetical protein OXD44_12015 [Gammaproteobacteria bacterium]|nr:hypothetical protein [Gammaproteobacteria bacterium]